jgi:predicted short-subunit dehydrogenase-like oxidoreductase (DUF2520 family)
MADADILESRVVLVGPGRAGRAFARSWSNAGGRIDAVVGREPREFSNVSGLPVLSVETSAFEPCDVVVLAVPDDVIGSVATRLAGRLPCRFAMHLSGAIGSEALAPFARNGAEVASVHPVRPFTGAREEDWRGAFVAVEGQPGAIAVAAAIVVAVGAHPHPLARGNRPLYHASATLAAGGVAALVSIAVRGWVAAGIPEDVARETLAGLASRATAAVGARNFSQAFTGAVARRDAGTVRAHLDALADDPRTLALYRTLAEEILRRTDGIGRESEIRALLLGRESGR